MNKAEQQYIISTALTLLSFGRADESRNISTAESPVRTVVRNFMKQSLLFIFIFFYRFSFGQYNADTTLKAEYWRIFERLPEKVKKDKDTEFKSGLGILIGIKTDTLNKKDLEPIDTSLKIFNINQETGEEEPLTTNPSEEETINAEHPQWLSCGCRFKGDTLEIYSGISLFSGFAVITKMTGSRAAALYTEHESEGKVFRTKLTNKKVSEFIIPATINSLTIDRRPDKGLKEIYGKIAVTTNGYYTYVNAWGFKHDYIYKRMRLQFYFRCDTAKQRTTSALKNKG
jgi:hypothetical protein